MLTVNGTCGQRRHSLHRYEHRPDRISKTIRDAAGQIVETRTAVGTDFQASEVRTEYSLNGRPTAVRDGENNRTSYVYDGHDRLRRTLFPLAAQGSNASNAADFEELGYDLAGNVITRLNRAGETAAYTFDALGRITSKNLPGSEPDVTYGYDLLGRMTSASQTGQALTFSYDALGRRLSETGPLGTVTSTFDVAGRRTMITHPDGRKLSYGHDLLGRLEVIHDNESVGALEDLVIRYWYGIHGRRFSAVRAAGGWGSTTVYYRDSIGRVSFRPTDGPGESVDFGFSLAYNPAGQIASRTAYPDAFQWNAAAAGTTNSTANGLNQITVHDGATLVYGDARGNLTNDGAGRTFVYDSENRLVSSTGPNGTTSLAYDPLGRLASVSGASGTTRFLHDGGEMIAEYNLSGQLLRRHVFGPWTDEPVATYEGASLGLAARRYLQQDERGSVTIIVEGDGSLAAVNRYDELGAPQGAVSGRFGFTGQPWLPELGIRRRHGAALPAQWRRARLDRRIGGGAQPVRPRARLAKCASIARRMPSAIWAWPSGEWI